tara:strand:- start:10170 stop:10589 length:420 start_codon:yes stop_codon:yes gene_type:complete
MKKISIIFLALLSFACSQKVTQEQLNLLNGYWEIEKVTFADGQTKEYTVNESIDYIQINGLKGFRKKVKPTFEGTYITNDDAEFFTLFKKEDTYIIQYKTEVSDWTETLKTISNDNFSVTNSENITYTYKRYEPINISK